MKCSALVLASPTLDEDSYFSSFLGIGKDHRLSQEGTTRYLRLFFGVGTQGTLDLQDPECG